MDISVVLNLVINGIPSILWCKFWKGKDPESFKPCYKWNTFNTCYKVLENVGLKKVLNLVINGIPSILKVDTIKLSTKE